MSSNFERYLDRLAEAEAGTATHLFEVIIKYSGSIHEVETELGVQIEVLGDGFAIVTLRAGQIQLLYGYKEIIYIELPKTLTPSLNQSIRASCISSVQDAGGMGLTGKGVLIGIIDSGLDYTHPDFRNPDGTSRILYLWDQTVNGSAPEGFIRGTEYDSGMINAALGSPDPLSVVPTADMSGHGTAVTGVAAGNGASSGGRETGAAPEASLIIVKLGYGSAARTTEVMRAVKYILDKAETLRMPVAVNISYGTNDGSHDGSSLFESYINSAAQRWKSVIVTASGNEGASGRHFSGKLGQGRTADAGFTIGDAINSFYLTLWKRFTDDFILELILPGGGAAGPLDPSRIYTEMNIGGTSILVFYGQPTHYSEDQEIFVLVEGQPVPQGLWKLIVNGVNIVDGRFDIWLPTAEEAGIGTGFTEPSADTTLTLPSTAKDVITVGGYNAVTDTAATFSGRGFARSDAYIKPDLTAPAVGVISTRAGGGYDSFTGTSMAAPFVTGAAALMLEWGIVQGNDRFLYGQRVKAFLKKGARRSPGLSYPNTVRGFGALCLRDTMKLLVNAISGDAT